jgi:hypothetical protein
MFMGDLKVYEESRGWLERTVQEVEEVSHEVEEVSQEVEEVLEAMGMA